MNRDEAVTAINQILRQLELDADAVVREVSLRSLETTRLESDRREFRQTVVIDLERLPGNSWQL